MANATAITVTDLLPHAVNTPPTADVLDTGQAAVTLPAAVGAACDRIILEVTNSMGAGKDLTVTIKAGGNPPAVRAGLGDLALTVPGGASPVTRIIGPLETARFLQVDGETKGRIDVQFTPPQSTTIAAGIRCYRLPKTV
ncbi:MAG: hypothetical protein N2439_10025 [Anaerolineae bacterium]|nr:hypothetical protein [Anaerolineae bacterium]